MNTFMTYQPADRLYKAAKALLPQHQTPKLKLALREIEIAIQNREQYPGLIQTARDTYCTDDIEIDDHPVLSITDSGAWINAWVFVPHPNQE